MLLSGKLGDLVYIQSSLKLSMDRSANDSTSSSEQRISKDIVTEVVDEPDFVDDELGSDTDDDDATAAAQPCALDDLELF
ncbi:hypothetical protein SUGI_0617700 [Cryptomeria japonica]|nr:hypothetical protein SUGI_0617700 [Cryptomeria japonica]